MGEGFAFDIELRRGAGAYICGEETALFNSIEGKRGEPRNKPPFPVQRGLFGKPTGINNVETLINVLEILRIGGLAYAEIGTEGSTGPRLFCVSGTVARPGLYEVESGATLREVLALAGGTQREREGRSCSAARPAGSSPRTTWTSGSRSRTRAPAATRWARASSWCSTSRSTWWTSCCGSRGSSATNPAASASRVAWAPCVRRRRCTGWCTGAHDRLARAGAGADRRDRPGHARRVDLRARARRRQPPYSLRCNGSTCSTPKERAHERDPAGSAPPAPRHRGRRADGPGRRGRDDPRCLSRPGDRHAHAVLRRQPHAGERVPRLRRRGRGRAHAGARVQPRGRGRDEGHDRHRARAAFAQARDGVPGVERRRRAHEPRRPPLDGRVRGRPRPVRRADGRAPGGRSRRALGRATTTTPPIRRSPSRSPSR